MKTYIAKKRIDFGGKVKVKEIGDTVELDDEAAKPLLAIQAIQEHDPKAAFQDALTNTERAAHELEAAGGNPGEAAREMQRRQAEETASIADGVNGMLDAAREIEAAQRKAEPAKGETRKGEKPKK